MINLLSKATFSLPILCRLSMTKVSLFSYCLKLIIVKIASFDSAHILSTWRFTMLKGKKLYLEHEITCIKICLQLTKNKRRKQEFICFKIILPLKFIYNDNNSCKKLSIHSVSIGIWSAHIEILNTFCKNIHLLSKNCVKKYVLSPFFQLAKDVDLRKSS